MIEDSEECTELRGVQGGLLRFALHEFHDEVTTTLAIFEEVVDFGHSNYTAIQNLVGFLLTVCLSFGHAISEFNCHGVGEFEDAVSIWRMGYEIPSIVALINYFLLC